jgi:hypothetical protein
MPNWCEGTLKVRGKKSDIAKWVRENVTVYSHNWSKNSNGMPYYEQTIKPDAVIVEYDDDPTSEEICVTVTDEAHIKSTRRNFVQKDEYWASEHNGVMVLVLNFQAAWGIVPEPYVKMSQEYHVDFRLHGFERGMEFNQEVIVEGGQLVSDMEITFDDYRWECPFPQLGG